jgi:hypothetical protein
LGQEFDRIVKAGSFKREVADRALYEALADFNFCGYYVALLVLRFLGHRQQCLRDCKIGENITFNRDGSITLFWPKDKIKNRSRSRLSSMRKNGHTKRGSSVPCGHITERCTHTPVSGVLRAGSSGY